MCLQCGEVALEDVHHFLFQCPRYDRERHVMRNALGRDATSLSYLLSNQKAQSQLIKYVATTKRLQNTFGEVLKQ